MKTKTTLSVYICLGMLLFTSCSSDDSDSNGDPSSNVISINIDEYPSSGTFLFTINSSLAGDLTYTITSQTSALAIIISNGELSVGDWLAYDYEENDRLLATVEVSNGTETETLEYEVNINDVDDIWAFLNTSRSNYESASNGQWVWITESEYNDLANYLAETTKSGAEDNDIFNNTSVTNYSGNRTIANDNGVTIPQGSYVFAFKYYSWINNVVSNKVKLSQGDSGGAYLDFGGVLPEHDDEFNHFVLKGVNSQTTSEGYIGMYTAGAVGVKSNSGSRYKWRNGDVDNLDNATLGSVFLLQGLSTTLKQWD